MLIFIELNTQCLQLIFGTRDYLALICVLPADYRVYLLQQ